MKLPIAIQLYSVRNEAEKDFEFVLREIKSYGYDGVELAGLYGKTPKELKALLDSVGLVAISAHVSYGEMCNDISAVISDYKAIGCEYIAVPWLDQNDRLNGMNSNATLENLNKLAKAAKEANIPLCYHNHQFEFEKIGENFAFDVLFEKVPQLLVEQDSCWLAVAGESPVEYLKKYSDRTPLLHLKDYYGSAEKGDFEFRPVGFGVMDFNGIVNTAKQTAVEWLIVEQDEPSAGLTPLECAKKSIDFLKTV